MDLPYHGPRQSFSREFSNDVWLMVLDYVSFSSYQRCDEAAKSVW